MAKEVNLKYNLIPKVTAYLSDEDLEKFLTEMFETKFIKKNMHIDRTVGGLTLDEIDELIERQKNKAEDSEEASTDLSEETPETIDLPEERNPDGTINHINKYIKMFK